MFTSFISYRRNGGGTFALLLEEKLEKNGFSPFLDHKHMHAGRFDLEIARRIDEASDVIVILSKDCFVPHGDRDYYFEEIEYALKKEKRMIPIILQSYTKPDVFPDEIKEIENMQGINEMPLDVFDTVFLPKLISYMSDTEEKRNYERKKSARALVSSRKELERVSLDERWKNAVEISVCSHLSTMLLSSERLIRALESGIHIRFVIVEPDSFAMNEAIKYRLKNVRATKFKRAYEQTQELLADAIALKQSYEQQGKAYGVLEAKTTTLILSEAMMIVRKKNIFESTIKLDLYTFHTDPTDRRSLLIPYEDRENYDFFCEEFEMIWNSPETKPIPFMET